MSYHIETSQLICTTNQLTGLYMMTTLAFNELIRGGVVIKFLTPETPKLPSYRNQSMIRSANQ